MLLLAIITISAALVFYTAAVFWEKKTGCLRGCHILLFWIGLFCDTTGTTLMGQLAGKMFQMNFHGLTGAAAIVLMLVHVIWATAVHASRRPEPKAEFHRFSIFVWALWLVPYISGMIYGMSLKP